MTKIRLITKSHLNDALIDMECNPYMAQRRITFVKYLLDLYPDGNTRVDDDHIEVMWYNFTIDQADIQEDTELVNNQ